MSHEEEHLSIAGVDVATLAKVYGTPLYVYDEEKICGNVKRLLTTFQKRFSRFECFYAIKANSNPAVATIITNEGVGIDAASLGEIELAKKIGLSGERILFTGNFLSDDDLQTSLHAGATINLDDASLLPRLLKFGKPERLCFRVNPGIGKSNVGEEDVFGGERAKFGIPFEHAEAVYRAAQDAGVKRFGMHMMTGSCITDPDYFAEVTRRLMDIVGGMTKHLSLPFEFVNLGGGLGIPYRPDEASLDLNRTADLIVSTFAAQCKKHHMTIPTLMMEPGRFFVGDAGFLIGRVHAVKESYQRFVGTDIGFNILMRPTLYDAYHHIRVDGKENLPRTSTNITGQLCENTDVWCRDRMLPPLDVEDLIVVENAGAYGYCMSFPYNGRLRPAEVLVTNGKHRLIRRRETIDDLLSGVVW